jgi:hypothetical protein
MRQREEMAEALRTAPHKMQAVAKELRRVAGRLDDAARDEDDEDASGHRSHG